MLKETIQQISMEQIIKTKTQLTTQITIQETMAQTPHITPLATTQE